MDRMLGARPLSCFAALLLALSALPAAAPAAHAQDAPARAARPPAGTTERRLRQIEDDFAQAVVRRDAAALRRIVAPKWVYSDESGVMTRDEGIRAFTGGPDTVTSAGNDSMRVITYGSTAVVIGVLWMKGRGPGGAFSRRYRYTDTWMKLEGRWQCIASQDYLMPG